MPASDSDDSLFNPKSAHTTEISVPETTPASRLAGLNAVDEATRNRVRSIDPNEGSCLIENCIERRAVEFCYCYPRHLTMKSKLLDNIEWHWNMERGTLNLDSSRNIFRAGAALHQMHDNHCWFLLPEEGIIDEYNQSLRYSSVERWMADRTSFPVIPDREDFQYRMIPVPHEMDSIGILRQNSAPSTTTPLTSADFTVYVYPFKDMPALKSHLHPKFVILEAGRKLKLFGLTPTVLIPLTSQYPILDKVARIYEAWTSDHPANAMGDATYNPPDEGAMDEGPSDDGASGRRTEPHRYGTRSRKRRDDNGSPKLESKRSRHEKGGQARKRRRSACLSEKSIVEHDKAYGRQKWTRKAVDRWAKERQLVDWTTDQPRHIRTVCH